VEEVHHQVEVQVVEVVVLPWLDVVLEVHHQGVLQLAHQDLVLLQVLRHVFHQVQILEECLVDL
jgi:hypothetical protein